MRNVWFLPSLGRPDKIRTWVVDAYEWAGEKVALLLYSGDPRLSEYTRQKWPKGWKIEIVDCIGNPATLNEAFRRYPNEKSYGIVCDDTTPETPGMLSVIEESAGGWSIAYPNDGHFKEVLAMLCAIGGDLVRAVGEFSPSEFKHGGLDSMWHDIAHELRTLRYHPNLHYTHHYPSNPGVDFDSTHMHTMNLSKDAWLVFKNWREGPKAALIERLRPMMKAAGVEPQGQPIIFV